MMMTMMAAWENTLLASRVLPPSYVPVDSSANANRTADASMVLDQDGRLTLLIILTTAAGLAIVLLFFLLLRIGCLRKKTTCFWRIKEQRERRRRRRRRRDKRGVGGCGGSSSAGDRSSSYLASVAASNNANERRCSAKSSAASLETLQTRSEHDKASNYTIKLIDNDLIIEARQHEDMPAALGVSTELPFADASAASVTTVPSPEAAPSGSVLFKSWLLALKNKEWDNQSLQMGALETKSLCGSPGRRLAARRSSERHDWLADQRQQILARFGQHLPGFGFTRSGGSSVDASQATLHRAANDESVIQSVSTSPVRYSYSYGNQTEYMGGPYGYVDPVFAHHFRSTPDGAGQRSVRDHLAPSVARSAESLLVVGDPIPYPSCIASNQPHRL